MKKRSFEKPTPYTLIEWKSVKTLLTYVLHFDYQCSVYALCADISDKDKLYAEPQCLTTSVPTSDMVIIGGD